ANIRQPMKIAGVPTPFDPAKPAMMTLYIGFPQPGVEIGQQTAEARMRLFSTSYADFEFEIRKQLQTMFGEAGFDARRDIAGIVLNRWGHAYIAPPLGFFHGQSAAHELLRKPHGRIIFA